MFIHDFVRLGLPYESVLEVLPRHLGSELDTLVRDAWAYDRDLWVAAGLAERDLLVPAPVNVVIGAPRVRRDAVVVSLSWPLPEARLVPAVDADLELARCGTTRCDLQIMGRYNFGPEVVRWSEEGSMAHRVTVNGIRRLLELLATKIEHQTAPGIERHLRVS